MGPSKEKIAALEKRALAAGIQKKDVEEKFIKSSGRGGQKVNKTSSAVFLKHLPTGITVKCGSERSRHLNRFLALRRLVDQVEAAASGGVSTNNTPQMKRIVQLRKQKAKRKKRARSKRVKSRSSEPTFSPILEHKKLSLD